ncbi:S-layer homology domain-containing protein [Paenibacillus terrigena]|uniref:S-layer homology domain-containing protein n=1 Tax=Paenibacillus terrigena TaxID=369333 RepID=UPI00035C6E72|nr:S-layer homology domain-containing protein [Paenibacillus terrigena]
MGYGWTFKPDARITRAEFTKIVVNAFCLKPNVGKVFEDTKGHWAKLPKLTHSNPERRFKGIKC